MTSPGCVHAPSFYKMNTCAGVQLHDPASSVASSAIAVSVYTSILKHSSQSSPGTTGAPDVGHYAAKNGCHPPSLCSGPSTWAPNVVLRSNRTPRYLIDSLGTISSLSRWKVLSQVVYFRSARPLPSFARPGATPLHQVLQIFFCCRHCHHGQVSSELSAHRQRSVGQVRLDHLLYVLADAESVHRRHDRLPRGRVERVFHIQRDQRAVLLSAPRAGICKFGHLQDLLDRIHRRQPCRKPNWLSDSPPRSSTSFCSRALMRCSSTFPNVSMRHMGLNFRSSVPSSFGISSPVRICSRNAFHASL
jgi:hypothetical protein